MSVYNFEEFRSNVKYVIKFEHAWLLNDGSKDCVSATAVSQRHAAKI